jgi:hypothetical protein
MMLAPFAASKSFKSEITLSGARPSQRPDLQGFAHRAPPAFIRLYAGAAKSPAPSSP